MEAESIQSQKTFSFEFTGKADEYFKIWVVNILLTILTLGIYSAWAKVRKKQYFYGNTVLREAFFEYLADPVKILKGRLIVLGLFIAYTAASINFVTLATIQGLLIMVLFPWLFVKAMKFRTRNSAYRNIRFNFTGTYGEAAGVFIGTGIIVGITFGLAYPYFIHRRRELAVSKSAFGTSRFSFSATVGSFYDAYVKAGAILFFVWLLSFGVIQLLPFLAAVLFSVGFLVSYAYLDTCLTNLVYSGTSTKRFRLQSTLVPLKMIRLYLTNTVAIIFSLGLMIPWASIRMARYRLDNLKLLETGDLDGFIAGDQKQVSAAGEEIGEFFDFDIGL